MSSYRYHAFDNPSSERGINAYSLASEEYPLLVNHAGCTETVYPFRTDNAAGREDYYLMHIVKGSMEMTLPEGIRQLSAGDTALFPPHCHYRYLYRGKEPLTYLWVHFTGSYAEKLLTDCKLGSGPRVCRTEADSRIAARFRGLFDAFERKSPLWRQETACELERLLLTVALSVKENACDRTLEASMRRIHSSYHTELRIPELARLENLSNSRYIALFRSHMGMSPSAYIIGLRMNVACDLLQNTDMSVKQIGQQVGYGDPHFFSKLFKKKMGVSPQAYRQSFGGRNPVHHG